MSDRFSRDNATSKRRRKSAKRTQPYFAVNLPLVIGQSIFRSARVVQFQKGRPFLRCPKPLFQSEAKCKAIQMKIIFQSYSNETHFRMKGLALSLALKVRVCGTWKWPTIKAFVTHLLRRGTKVCGIFSGTKVTWSSFPPLVI